MREMYSRFVAIPDAPANITTDADRQAQETILGYLHQQFPHDALCAEEKTAALLNVPHTGDRLWIVDPIDGTRGFARKNGEFSVMVAFVEKGKVAVGVVLEPAHDLVTFASRGSGCWQRQGKDTEPKRCQVGTTRELSQATLTQSRPHSESGPTRAVRAIKAAKVIETYSAGVKLALVARGEADVYINNYWRFHDWDIAAGHILVEEAGGKVTGLGNQELCYGTESAWQREGLLATNGALHEAAIAGWKKVI